MNILLLGAGGREHALAWRIKKSPLCRQLFIAPGNAGTAQCGTNLDVKASDFEKIKTTCLDKKIDLLIVGPEEPLVNGVVDFLKRERGLKNLLIIGPSQGGAQLEGSKGHAKRFMQRHGIPTAAYEEFGRDTFTEGVDYIHRQPLPVVLKADGLAAGKGVVICQNHVEAVAEFEMMTQHLKFGEAGNRVVIEDYLEGIELSVFVLTDGEHYVLLPEAKDYKRIGEFDTGPNTGGMGAVSPVPFAGEVFMRSVVQKIIEPTVKGLHNEGIDYKGFIFFGLMKVDNEPYVIEYNCRLGDPETEAILPRLKNDLLQLLMATAKGELNTIKIEKDERVAATIVAVSGGYPDEYEQGYPIAGLDTPQPDDVYIFQAGTQQKEAEVITAGGRVFCVTAPADTLTEALEKARAGMDTVDFDDKYYRTDIGFEFDLLSPNGGT